MDPKSLDLDCAAPDQVARVLRNAADKYRESAVELQAAWQDKGPALVWSGIARELERAAERIEAKL
jgi:hypothetical protein